MKTHYEHIEGEIYRAREVIDSRNTYRCSRGHFWEETKENRFEVLMPITFPFPGGDMLCPFCLSEFFAPIGHVIVKEENVSG